MKNKKKMPLKARKFLKVWVTAVLVIFVIGAMALTCFAAEDDPITVVNNLSDFMFGLVRAVGMIMLGFAVVQIGLSLKSHDPSQRANGFLTLAGGVVITFAKEILNLITGASAITQVWTYVGEIVFNMLVLVGTVKLSDQVVSKMLGI